MDGLREADLFRLCVPSALGGAEAPPLELVETVEALARADASAGWCLAVTATSGLVAAYLEEDAAREVFGTPRRGRGRGIRAARDAPRAPGTGSR